MEIIIAIATFFLGYFAEKLMDNISIKFFTKRKIRKIKKAKEKLKKQHPTNAIMTESVYPYVSSDKITIEELAKKMFLSFPDELRHLLKSIEGDFAEKDMFFCEPTIPGCSTEEVKKAIETARKEIAIKFINREDGLYFNGTKLGVAKLDTRSRSTDIRETPLPYIQVFRTDHFTHRVISRAVEILGLPKDYISDCVPNNDLRERLNGDLKWIRTSFGVSVIIVLKSTNQIILTRRSKNASFSEGKDWIYVSVTEALSQTDFDAYKDKIDLSLCVKRGVDEELGIDETMFDGDIKIHDFFFETQFFQDGVVASINISEDVKPQDIINLRAKDKLLEVQEILFVDNTKEAIEKYISENDSEMRSQTIFALRSYLASL